MIDWLQMLAFSQHPYMLLSGKAFPLWIALLSSRETNKQEAPPPNPAHSVLPLECVAALLDLAGAIVLEPQNLEVRNLDDTEGAQQPCLHVQARCCMIAC